MRRGVYSVCIMMSRDNGEEGGEGSGERRYSPA